jgi:hypothetical protein
VAKLNKRLKRTLPSVLVIIGGAPLSRALARMTKTRLLKTTGVFP